MDNVISWLSRKINYPLSPPRVIQVSLTYRCNLRCKMCSIANLLPESEELPAQKICRIIDEAKKYNIKQVLLTGGEPFLRGDIFEICKYCHDKGLLSVITTNGALINDDMAEAIFESKVNHIHFSLDGLEETHNFFRGSGVFKKVINAINLLNEKRKNNGPFSLGIAFTVMDKNVGELFEVVKLADDLNIDAISFQPLVKDNANFLDKTKPPFWVKGEDIAALREEIIKIRGYKPRHLSVQEEPHLELLTKYYQGKLTRADWVCFGGFKTVFICFAKNEPLVYSCHGICGNLDNISLRKAWTSKEAYKLRIHSGNCKDLCMQSCYSQESVHSLSGLIRPYIGKARWR